MWFCEHLFKNMLNRYENVTSYFWDYHSVTLFAVIKTSQNFWDLMLLMLWFLPYNKRVIALILINIFPHRILIALVSMCNIIFYSGQYLPIFMQ